MINVRKQAAFFGAILLFFQAVPLSLTQVYAETDDAVDPQLFKAFRSYEPEYLNLNQSMISSESETEAVQEFSFVEKTFRTTVGQPVLLRFTSALPANEVLLRIPDNGQIVEEAFSNGEAIRHSHGEYWLLKTSKHQNEFVLPVVFEEAGQYFLTVNHDADHFYLEVEEGPTETRTAEVEAQETSDSTEKAEMNTEEQQESQELASINNLPIVVQPVTAIEKNLSISEDLIAAEEARIFEEITDPQNRSTDVSNWSQFRSAWNSSSQIVVIRMTSNINFSSSILGSSLNKITASKIRSIVNNSTTNLPVGINMGTSGNSLHLENSSLITRHVRIESENSGTQPLIELDRSSSWDMDERTVIINKRNSSAVAVNDGSRVQLAGTTVRRIIYNQAAVSPVQLSRNSTFDFFVGSIVIGSNPDSNSWIPPISSDAGSKIVFSRASSNVMMGGRIDLSLTNLYLSHLTSYRVPWNSVTAEITGVNGSIITSSNSDPNDFAERYLANYSLVEYRSLTVGATTSEGFVPPISRYNLTLAASPPEAGTPQADSTAIAANTTALIQANPNEGYRFVSWEILSGTGAKIADETAETTTFTMGSSDVVVQANYEEEATEVRPVDPLDPEKEVDPDNPPILPEEQGLFSIDFASQFDFGVQAISAQDQTYYAKPQRLLAEDGTVLEGEERPNYVQISDRRPTQERDGWELSVRQNDQFHTATGQELTGARLVLQNQQIATAQGGTAPGLAHTNPMTLNPGGAKRTLLKAQGPEGEGTWIYRFGDAETAAQSVALEVPKGATPTADHYKTTLTWELSSVPKN